MVYDDIEMLGVGKFRIKNSYLYRAEKCLPNYKTQSDVDKFRKIISCSLFVRLFSITVS